MIEGEHAIRETPDRLAAGLISRANRWETYLVIIGLATCTIMASLSPYFLDLNNLLYATSNSAEKAMIAIPLAMLVLVGDIDVSVASTTALAAVALGIAGQAGFDTPALVMVGLAVGTIAGAANGLLVTRFKISSIVVTIGTLSLLRGLAVVLVGENALTTFPDGYSIFGQGLLFDAVPFGFIAFICVAIGFGAWLHMTVYGRRLFAIGNNPQAARNAGIRVDRYRLALFVLTGTLCGLAAVILTSRLLSVRLNAASGWELEIITMVVLGGISITGGKGTIAGVILAVLVLVLLNYGLSLLNVPSILIDILIGTLMISAIGVPNLVNWLRARIHR